MGYRRMAYRRLQDRRRVGRGGWTAVFCFRRLMREDYRTAKMATVNCPLIEEGPAGR